MSRPSRLPVVVSDALTGALRDGYRAQLQAVQAAVASLDDAAALAMLQQAMQQVWTDSYQLAPADAQALARLATILPPRARTQPPVAAVVERCALQRALVLHGLGAALSPYFHAAACGAAEGFALDASTILTHDPAAARRRSAIPTLPPIHSQNREIASAAASPLFAERPF